MTAAPRNKLGTDVQVRADGLVRVVLRDRLDVLIVYDTLRSGKHAKELCDRLGGQLAPAFKVNLSVWSLSALQLLPTMAQAAAREAEHAALLIVAVNGAKTVPRTAKSCLDRCARGLRAAGGALVAQLHGILKTNKELCPACGCLRAIARHVGLRFFSEAVELPDHELTASLERVHDHAQSNALAATKAQSIKISNNSTHAAP